MPISPRKCDMDTSISPEYRLADLPRSFHIQQSNIWNYPFQIFFLTCILLPLSIWDSDTSSSETLCSAGGENHAGHLGAIHRMRDECGRTPTLRPAPQWGEVPGLSPPWVWVYVQRGVSSISLMSLHWQSGLILSIMLKGP